MPVALLAHHPLARPHQQQRWIASMWLLLLSWPCFEEQ
jgi:hypothetical protein